jgi:hypothetical protein
MHALAPQVDIAVFQAGLVRIDLPTRHLQGQYVGGGLHRDVARKKLHFAGRQTRVHRPGLAEHHLAGHRDAAFHAQRIGGGKRRRAVGKHDLGQAVMVAQIDEQQAAMVALAVHPAGQACLAAGIGGAQGAAGVGAVGMHSGLKKKDRPGALPLDPAGVKGPPYPHYLILRGAVGKPVPVFPKAGTQV